jgi:hypothetical protein
MALPVQRPLRQEGGHWRGRRYVLSRLPITGRRRCGRRCNGFTGIEAGATACGIVHLTHASGRLRLCSCKEAAFAARCLESHTPATRQCVLVVKRSKTYGHSSESRRQWATRTTEYRV